MKKSATLLFLLLLCIRGVGQQVLFSEDFESFPGYNITGWTHSYTGSVPWMAGEPYLVGGLCNNWPGTTKIAGIPDCGAFDYDNSNVLMASPAIDMHNITGAWLRYDSYFLNYSQGLHTEMATVEVSADGGTTWDTIQTVPANPATGLFTTWYLDLSAYDNMNDVRVGFRYNDGSGHTKGWAVDNVQVFVPGNRDLMMVQTGARDSLLNYAAIGSGVLHEGRVFNYGLDTVHSFVIKYRQGNGPVHPDTISGVQILPFSFYNFTHTVPDTVLSAGTLPVTMWVELDGDSFHGNDTVHTEIRGAYFMPQKRLVIEEGTGTFNVWGPRGLVYMNQAAQNNQDICQIAVHSTDPMEVEDYADYLFYVHWNYVPYFLFDRRQNVEPDSFFSYITRQKKYFGFAGISLDGGINGNQLEVNVQLKPAIDMHGDFRLVLVVTEDDVTGTASGYEQRNKYAGGAYGPMGGYENKPDPVPAADMHYNFVARLTSPAPDGAPGVIPTDLIHNTQYNYTLSAALDPSWEQDKLKAEVLLIRAGDSSILNSNVLTGFPVAVHGPDPQSLDAGLYPNPARGTTTLYFNLPEARLLTWSITDISGRVLFNDQVRSYPAGRNELQVPVANLNSGIYLVQLSSGAVKKTLKLQVWK